MNEICLIKKNLLEIRQEKKKLNLYISHSRNMHFLNRKYNILFSFYIVDIQYFGTMIFIQNKENIFITNSKSKINKNVYFYVYFGNLRIIIT